MIATKFCRIKVKSLQPESRNRAFVFLRIVALVIGAGVAVKLVRSLADTVADGGSAIISPNTGSLVLDLVFLTVAASAFYWLRAKR